MRSKSIVAALALRTKAPVVPLRNTTAPPLAVDAPVIRTVTLGPVALDELVTEELDEDPVAIPVAKVTIT